HEFGHALVNWLAGRPAVPLPTVTLYFTDTCSPLFALAVAAALGALLWKALVEDCRFLAGLCALLFLAQGWLVFIAPWRDVDFLVNFGGLGGECVVSAALVALYFQPMPRFTRWPAVRVFFLAVGALALAQSLRTWTQAARDFANVPWGGFWGGDGDVGYMMARGWTVNHLVAVYLRLARVCAACALAAWGWAAWAAWRSPLPKRHTSPDA
ncbi:MAG: hypothetical protein KGL53_07640, partial [Elusimicrobia bacterium]|nr:hypothetical protein [Elusimicrobiota bacterium]